MSRPPLLASEVQLHRQEVPTSQHVVVLRVGHANGIGGTRSPSHNLGIGVQRIVDTAAQLRGLVDAETAEQFPLQSLARISHSPWDFPGVG